MNHKQKALDHVRRYTVYFGWLLIIGVIHQLSGAPTIESTVYAVALIGFITSIGMYVGQKL